MIARLLLLLAAAVVMQVGWVILWLLSYRLTHGNGYTFEFLTTRGDIWERLYDLLVLANTLVPGIEPPQSLDPLINGMVVAFVLTGVGYLGGLTLLGRGLVPPRVAVWVVYAVMLVFQVTLYLMPGVWTTDIFSYMMYGHISATYGLNPYIYPPLMFPGNPILEWIHPIWHDAPSVYGPLWTNVGWLATRLTGSWPLVDQVLAYKALMNVVHLANSGLVWWLLGRFQPPGGRVARVTAFTLFAWNPMLLFEVSANAHNDALMVTFLLLGLVPLALAMRPGGAADTGAVPNGSWLLSLVCVGLSALVKYTTGVVGVFFAVAWFRQLGSWRARLAWLGAGALLMGGLTLLLWWPWLKLPDVLQPVLSALAGKNYTNSIPDWLAILAAEQVLDPQGLNRPPAYDLARQWSKGITRVLFAGLVLWEVARVWRHALDGPRTLAREIVVSSTRIFLALLLLVLTWVLTWYFTWPLALATMLGWRSLLTRATVGLTLTSLPIFYVHHYWSTSFPNALLFLYALPPFLVPWAYARWKDRNGRRSRPAVADDAAPAAALRTERAAS